MVATGRPGEPGVAEGEDAAVGTEQPVAAVVGGGGDADDGGVEAVLGEIAEPWGRADGGDPAGAGGDPIAGAGPSVDGSDRGGHRPRFARGEMRHAGRTGQRCRHGLDEVAGGGGEVAAARVGGHDVVAARAGVAGPAARVAARGAHGHGGACVMVDPLSVKMTFPPTGTGVTVAL